ncbi:HAD-IIA family hydrolase [Rathayibacter sp. Leaf296]|uniref:HAD-IIA family hydrolase n=1 Tax=Rathayibacter sp. Leaf296 TaxID=1736327 RepID=UPI00070338F0|nr:HAD-IIA family hydrolase [Rathayibacter sp. Leaf296]KQQ08834.1 haloacid dehalogenase [Rathayibacter sp. Leaf296]
MFRTPKTDPSPLEGRDAVLADLDGVVYKGADAIPFAVDSLNKAGETLRVGYITNNASRTDASVAAHLSDLGLVVAPEDVVTSPQAAVVLLAGLVPAGSTILVIGGEGLTTEVERAGFRLTRSAEDSPAAVIQGFAPTVGWEQLAEASFALRTGIPWVATNTDWTIPVARGIAPGNGTLVSAVHTAVGRLPVVAGKPERAIFDAATARFGSANPLFLGDRLDTDIKGANAAGMESAHVLTGIDRAKQLLAADATLRPTYILGDLRELHLPYPATSIARNGTHSVRSAKVRLEGDSVVIVDAGDDELDLLRAACSVIWSSGRAIYGLEVPESLYS